jgi:glycine/D-amino acid oxidase-like deaminating enzyme
MQRRDFLWRGGAALSMAATAGISLARAAEPVALPPTALMPPSPPLPLVRSEMDRIIKITVCTRPFRAQGPRLDVERIDRKTVVHNYGHGGSGWSLSWGSSTIATANAMASGAREIGVIGCGALGLTSAILLQRAGATVTIYAKELPPEIRSSYATGVWSPDSRICLADQANPAFKALWAQMCRTSFRAYSNFLGLPGAPVEWTDSYELTDIPYEQFVAQQSEGAETVRFAEDLQTEMVPEIVPGHVDLPASLNPFPVPYARRSSNMQFNLIAYQRLLIADFRENGGRIEIREFNSPQEFAKLPQKTIVNCTGYGARALFKDESIVPIRGQLTRLIPQPELNYSLQYADVFMVPRRDGIVLQYLGGGAAQGWNDSSTEPDRGQAEQAVLAMAKLNSLRPGS